MILSGRPTPYNGVEVITRARVRDYANGAVTVETVQGEKSLPRDSAIPAVGYQKENALYHGLEFDVPEIYLLGSAKAVSNNMYAIWDAFKAANHI